MTRLRAATAVALLVSSATVASLAAPGLADDTDPPAPVANEAPLAGDDEATVTSGDAVVVPVLENDTDPDAGSTSTLTLVGVITAPMHGSATPVAGGIEYLAPADFVGTDTFEYEVTDGELSDQALVTVTVSAAENRAPLAVMDQARTTWDEQVAVDVAGNDTDPDGDPVAVSAVGSPSGGTAELVDGQVVFTPTRGVADVVAVPYTIHDNRGGQADGELVVTVTPPYGVELTRVGPAVALRPVSVRGTVSTLIGGPVRVSLQRRTELGAWRTVAEQRVRNQGFVIAWTPPQPGRVLLRLSGSWSSGEREVSDTARVDVTARFDPVVSRVRVKDVPHSWRPGCPVGPPGLRKIEMSYWDYSGRLQRGTLIGAAYVTQDYLAIFRRAFTTGFQIKKMYPVDRYGGVDERAMRAGNTSAFNCRHVTGNPYRMSQHSYGDAIDINTFENPYVTGSRIYPPKAAVPYYHRRKHNLGDPGVITAGSSIARELWAQGWSWGARWSPPDYQHWSKNGG